MYDKKTVFITGACRNTGYAIARKFAKEGCNVCISSRKAEEAKNAAEILCRDFPEVTVKGYRLNPADVDGILKVFSEIRRDFGGLSAFVANAAHLGINMGLLNTTKEDYDAVMNANASGCFFCCQQAAKLMIESRGGAIVTMGSVHYKGAVPNRIVYSASKGAIMSMTRGMAYELSKYNIRVNCLVAGAIWSERWDNMPEEQKRLKRGMYPLGKESSPGNIAECVYFLCSDQCATVTGIDFTVDSGTSICLLPYDKEWDIR